MTRPLAYNIPIEDHGTRTRRLLLNIPAWLLGVLGAALMLVRCAFVFRENVASGPDLGWGVVLLAGILMATSIIVALACAAVGALIGYVLQRLFAGRPAS
jgi:hypothetical protein